MSKRGRIHVSWLLAGALLVLGAPALATPPQPPVTIRIGEKLQATAGRPGAGLPFVVRGREGQDVDVEAFIQRVGDEARVTRGAVKLGPELVARPRSVFKARVKAQAQPRSQLANLPAEPGLYRVTLRLVGKDAQGGFSDADVRYLRVDANRSATMLTAREVSVERSKLRRARFEESLRKTPKDPDIRLLMEQTAKVPDEATKAARAELGPAKRLQAMPVGPSQNLEGHFHPAEKKETMKRDPITVRGRLVYQDWDGAWKPLVNVSVNVWDDDTFGDEHLGVTGTDWDGNWSMVVNSDDGTWQDGRDIYYSFKLENTRIRVQNCSGIDSTYEWSSGVHDSLSDGTVLDFGSETGVQNPHSMQMWGHLNNAWNSIVVMSGQDPGFVDSCFPYDTTRWDRFWEEIDMEDQFMDGPDVVFHEYGHALMWYAYGEYNASPGGSHGFDDDVHPGLAWSEGFATGWMLMARPDGVFNWHEGDGGRAIESFSSGGVRTGERNEGRVAAALVDIFDAANDCNGGSQDRGRDRVCDNNAGNTSGLDLIYRVTMWGSRHDDVLQFWNQFSGELSSTQRPLDQNIMNYNYMTVPEAGTSCVATKVTTGLVGGRAAVEDRDRDALLGNLRRFRDLGLKQFPGGRQLMETYYRNSPELALLLLKDEAARGAALKVMRHFSNIGRQIGQERAEGAQAMEQVRLLPADVEEAARVVIKAARANASPELRADLLEVEQLIDKSRGLTLDDVRVRLSSTSDLKGEPLKEVVPHRLSPGSQRALKELPLK